MNFIKNIISKLSPNSDNAKYKLAEKAFIDLINSLSEEFPKNVSYTLSGSYFSFVDWTSVPNYKFVMCRLSEESIKKYSDKSVNIKVHGIEVFSNSSGKFVPIELLIHNNFISGVKTPNNDLIDLDMNQINLTGLQKSEFNFPKEFIDSLYNKLPKHIQNKINQDSIIEIQINNKTFYTILNLEDGNYLAIDKNQKVYSLIHDALPNSKLLKQSLEEIFSDIDSGKFTIDNHLKERYNA